MAAIGTQHRRLGLQDLCTDPLVVATRKGYRTKDAAHTFGAPLRSAALPAQLAARALHMDLSSLSTRGLRHWGLIDVDFLLFVRPTSIRSFCRQDLKLAEADITLQLHVFKYGEKRSLSPSRCAFHVAPAPTQLDGCTRWSLW